MLSKLLVLCQLKVQITSDGVRAKAISFREHQNNTIVQVNIIADLGHISFFNERYRMLAPHLKLTLRPWALLTHPFHA